MAPGIDLSPGAVIGRDFRVVRPLAEGGMGAVYVVEQISTAKPRALKVMHAQFAADPRSRERFVQEARAGGQVASDHVVEVVTAGVDEATGTPWMVMEFLDGETLDAAITRRGGLPIDEAWEVFSQFGHALAAAHAVGIVHRDLKPENIVLATPRRAGALFTVKVLDFGIAKLLNERAGTNTQAIGSPHWMAPEQTMEGTPIGPPTDVWALGLIAYHTLTGTEFWKHANDTDGNIVPLMVEIGAKPIPPASVRATEQDRAHLLPTGFDAWFARCVTRDIGARYEDGAVATAALLPLLRAPKPQPNAVADGTLPFAPTVGQPVYAPTAVTPPEPAVTAPAPTVATRAPTEPIPATPATQAGYNAGPVLTAAMPAAPVPVAAWSAPPPPSMVMAPSPPPVLRRRSNGRWWVIAVFVLVLVAGLAWAFTMYEPDIGPATPAATPAAEVVPFVAGQRWAGNYVCAQETTPMVLRIITVTGARVDGLFEFTHSSGNEGAYRVSGSYVAAGRRLPLTPGEWVRQPLGYEAVAMDGTVSPDGGTYAGRMLHPSCSEFSLRLSAE